MVGKTAIVVGATGLVGRALVDQLALAPHVDEIVTLTRRPAPHASPKVKNYVVDFEHLEQFSSLFKGHYLFSTLGTTKRDAGSVQAQRIVDFDYQLAAAKLAAENGVRHYLLVSSSFADPAGSTPYMKMKGELEQAVIALGFERVTIFQPFVLVGERENLRRRERAAAPVFRAMSALPGLGQFRPITGREVAAKMVRVSARPGPALERFRRAEMFEE